MDIFVLHPDDNIAVAARDLQAGANVQAGGRQITLIDALQLGHKVALRPIAQGQRVYKYGQTIGFASRAIEPGSTVHTHNLTAGDHDQLNSDGGADGYAFAAEVPPDPVPITDRTFLGYRRGDGRVGTRNYIAVISTVNCSASVSHFIARRFSEEKLKDYPNVDGVLPLVHKGGCGIAYDGEDHNQLDRVLAGFSRHPNVGAYVLVGLGCEVGTMSHLIESQGLVQIGGSNPPLNVLSIQACGGTGRTIEAGERLVAELLPRVNDSRREPVPACELVMATECGGSDGNSGVTANPALGIASDLLVAAGGAVILAETPEIYGAEHLLVRRARSREIGEKLIERIRWWERYAQQYGVRIDNNPTPGNKAGGITTIYEKSLGAVAKAGSTALCEVYRYAEPVTTRGFVVMDTPGYDPVSITGMVAGGATLIAFTTGRGSCFGCKPTPSVKIATNTPMFQRMEDDMDVNAGVILSGTPVKEVGRQIFELILEVASGRQTKSELHGVGEEEFAPWSLGPTL
jgi:altronate hydrolase